MSDVRETTPQYGVLYTELTTLARDTPLASAWVFESRARERDRPSVATSSRGDVEFWLDRSDPLLNTMLPGTHVSIVLNLGDGWAVGRTHVETEQLPRACVIGAFTRRRLLRLGSYVRAMGVVIPAAYARAVLGVPAAELVDRIVRLDELWLRERVSSLLDATADVGILNGAALLRDAALRSIAAAGQYDAVIHSALAMIATSHGQIPVSVIAERCGLSRQELSSRFRSEVGVTPKTSARLARFHALVPSLLSTEVGRWGAVAHSLGYSDQAHMVREFNEFAGAPPTAFFRPVDAADEPIAMRLRGRPNEWKPI